MTDPRLDRLLGTSDRDPGCDAGLDLIDEYCDLVHRGDPIPARFNDFLTHLSNCVTCREDTESLLAAIRDQDDSAAR
jgi:hypothetical protein